MSKQIASWTDIVTLRKFAVVSLPHDTSRHCPSPSLPFRGSTEGGEHCHYLYQCIYYAHSSRGGGSRKKPILAWFTVARNSIFGARRLGSNPSHDFLKTQEAPTKKNGDRDVFSSCCL